ncbi:MAG: ABC transporter ATP-binding protein, partial [Candidatus Paceibacterota bacterium]
SFAVKSSPVAVLNDIDLQIKLGEFVIITGSSGSGKSTLLHILLGLELPSSGSVSFLGQDIYGSLTEDQRTDLRKKNIGMVYQQPNWIKAMTVIENVMFATRINGELFDTAKQKSLAALNTVGMADWQDYYPTELSSGQQQKVALARAMVTNPSIIIADEPTGNLDFKSGRELMELLQKLNSEKKTIIMVTHDLEYLKYATRSLMMFDGKIVGELHKDDLNDKFGGLKKFTASIIEQDK